MPKNIESLNFDVETKRVLNAQSAGTSAVTPAAVIDVSDCEAFQIEVCVGSIASTGTVDFKLRHGDLSNGSDLADVEGSALTQMGDTDDNSMWLSEVIRPIKKYISFTITRGIANSAIDSAVIRKWGKRVKPITQDATVKAAEQLGSPASGTA